MRGGFVSSSCGARRGQLDARGAVVLSIARIQMRGERGNDAAAEQSRLRLLISSEIAQTIHWVVGAGSQRNLAGDQAVVVSPVKR